MAAKETDVWAGLELAAKRKAAGLTQAKLAELTNTDRATIIKLEKGTRPITDTYARRLAPHIGVKDFRTLLPPQEQPQAPENPLARLEALEGEVATLRVERDFALREVVARLAALEAAQAKPAQQSDQRSNRTTE